MKTLDFSLSPLTLALEELAPTSNESLFGVLQTHCEASSTLKVELSAVHGPNNSLSALIANGSLEEFTEELHTRLVSESGGDFTLLWAAYDNVKLTYNANLVLSEVTKLDETTISTMATELERLKELAEGVDFEALTSGISSLVQDFKGEEVPGLTASEMAFKFLASFTYRVFGQVQAPTNFWEIVLLKLETKMLPDGMFPETSPLYSVFRILEENIHNQAALYEYCLLTDGQDGSEKIAANIAALAFLKSAPTSYRRQLLMGLDANFFFELEVQGAFSDRNAPWRSALHNRLERSFADLFVLTADTAIEMREKLTALIGESEQRRKVAQQIAADLSQGMKGGDVLNRLAANCERIMDEAACAHIITNSFIEAKELFIPTVISALGISPRADLWRKHAQLLSGVVRASSEMESSLDWVEIGRLLTALDKRIVQMQGRPIRWMEAPGEEYLNSLELEAGSTALFQKLTTIVSARMVIEERYLGSRWKVSIIRWLVDQLFMTASQVDVSQLEHLLTSTFKNIEISKTDNATLDEKHLKEMGYSLSEDISRAGASAKLLKSSEAIAEGVAGDVFLALPDYAKKVGDAGLLSCQQDNQITLQKTAELLLSSDEDPSEKLSEWWTSLIGTYLANRPDSLFEANLSAIYRNIGKHLSPSHTNRVFSPIQAMYNDSLGVRCIEAMASRPLDPIGPLIEEYTEKPDLRNSAAQLITDYIASSKLDSSQLDEKSVSILTKAFAHYHASLWSEGSADIAAARVMHSLEGLENNEKQSAFVGDLLLALEGDNTIAGIELLQQTAHSFVDLIYRRRVADLLEEHSHDIAEYYSKSIITFAPDHFDHLSPEAAISKCSRDQSLLLKKVASCMRSSTPELAWFDLTRYFLELQSPYVDYPSRFWALSLRTVSKVLAKHLSAPECLYLVRFSNHGESIAEVWSRSHEIARALFDPSDYMFSAKPELDKRCRDLLTAVLVSDSFTSSGPARRQSFLNRIYLALDFVSPDSPGIDEVVSLVESNAAKYLTKEQALILSSAKADIEKLVSACQSTGDRLMELAKVDSECRQVSHLLNTYSEQSVKLSDSSSPVASVLKRNYLLKDLASGPDSCSEATFENEFSLQVLRILLIDPTLAESDPREMLSSSESEAGTISDLSAVSFLISIWPRLIEAASLLQNSDTAAAEFLEELNSGQQGPYNAGGEQCNETTKDGFAYVFRTAAVASVQRSISAPVLFFGRAYENHHFINLAVAANAHARTSLQIAKLLPANSLAGFELACDSIVPDGVLWRKVAYSSNLVEEAVIGEVHPIISACSGDFTPVETRVGVFISAYAAALSRSGDWQVAQSRMSLYIREAIQEFGVGSVSAAINRLAKDFDDNLDPQKTSFWKLHLDVIKDALLQVDLGIALEQNAAAAAKDYTEQKYEDLSTPEAIRCYRDQQYTLKLVGASLCNLDSESAILTPIKFHIDHVLPHLKNSSLELSQNWAFHEKWFLNNVKGLNSPNLHKWFGRYIRAYGRSTRLMDFVQNAVSPISKELSDRYELSENVFRDFISGLCAASLIDVEAGSPAVSGHVERLLLGSEIPGMISEDSFIDLCKTAEGLFDKHSAGKVPNLLKRTATQLPEIVSRILEACKAEGSNCSRFYVANANSQLAPSLWKASNLARCSLENRTLEADRNDTLVARSLRLDLPEDEEIIKEIISYSRAQSAATEASLKKEPQKKGLLGLFGKSDKDDIDWANNPDMRLSAERVFKDLGHANLLNIKPDYFAYFIKMVGDCEDMLNEKATVELLTALKAGLIKEIGEENSYVMALNDYIHTLPSLYSSYKLLHSELSGSLYFGLVCADLRSADDGHAYFPKTRPEADLLTIYNNNEEFATESLKAKLELNVSELKQSML